MFQTLESTFKDNLKYKGDLSFVAYCDFDTTATTDSGLDLENKKMFAVSYVIAFAFHPELCLDRIIIERSFGHSLE